MAARERQRFRFLRTGIAFNSRMSPVETVSFCRLDMDKQQYLEKMAECMRLSTRACHRILRVARTIADLEECDDISKLHLSEAVCYRRNELLGGEVH